MFICPRITRQPFSFSIVVDDEQDIFLRVSDRLDRKFPLNVHMVMPILLEFSQEPFFVYDNEVVVFTMEYYNDYDIELSHSVRHCDSDDETTATISPARQNSHHKAQVVY